MIWTKKKMTTRFYNYKRGIGLTKESIELYEDDDNLQLDLFSAGWGHGMNWEFDGIYQVKELRDALNEYLKFKGEKI